jgi:coenzyme F420-0:L-glutamate ligase/coenzyme F420-1:gamma-L-glutamate ligase
LNPARTLTIIPINGIPLIKESDSISEKIIQALEKNSLQLQEGDILVIAHTIISIAEGKLYNQDEVEVSAEARHIAGSTDSDAKRIEVALREAEDIIRSSPILITRTKHGIITDYTGIDVSNAPLGYFLAIPDNPNQSAEEISKIVSGKFGFNIPVIICDTQGRPWRRGAINLAIGYHGLSPFSRNAGKKDLYGNVLRSSLVCLADELAAAAELVMGQANEQIPVVIIRGVDYSPSDEAESIIRDDAENLFI